MSLKVEKPAENREKRGTAQILYAHISEDRHSSNILCTYFCNKRQPIKSMGSIYSINNTAFDKYMTHSYSISAYSKNTVQ